MQLKCQCGNIDPKLFVVLTKVAGGTLTIACKLCKGEVKIEWAYCLKHGRAHQIYYDLSHVCHECVLEAVRGMKQEERNRWLQVFKEQFPGEFQVYKDTEETFKTAGHPRFYSLEGKILVDLMTLAMRFGHDLNGAFQLIARRGAGATLYQTYEDTGFRIQPPKEGHFDPIPPGYHP